MTPEKIHYGLPGEDGFWPDELPPDDDPQQQPKDDIEVYGSTPSIVDRAPFEAKSGTIIVGNEEIDLPPNIRQTSQVIEQGKDGELHARPATANERGGGLYTIDNELAQKQIPDELPRSHHKSSHQVLNIPK